MRLVGFEPYDLPVKSRLLYQLSYRRKSIFCFRHFAFCFRFVFLITFNSPVYLFCIFSHVPDINAGNISWHGGARTHDTLVNGQALYLAELRANISLRAKTYPPITYSQNHMLNGAYGNRTRRLLLAKQASPHCD